MGKEVLFLDELKSVRNRLDPWYGTKIDLRSFL